MILSELSLVLDVTEKKECIFILVLFTEKKPQGYKPEIPIMTFLILSLDNGFF